MEIIISRNFRSTYSCKTFFTFDELAKVFNGKWVSDNYPSVKLFINTLYTGEEYKILAKSFNVTYMTKIKSFEEKLEVILNGCRS
jgi:hypothetical protein